MSSLALWLVFIFIQTIRHRGYFLPPESREDEAVHAASPSSREAWGSFTLLLISLVGVVGLAKVLSPPIKEAVIAFDAPSPSSES
jgi:Ca2+:H+ antiporter